METKFINYNRRELISREAYTYFKQNKEYNIKQYDDYWKWSRISKGLLHVLYLQQENLKYGIYIKGVGYFCRVLLKTVRGRKISIVRRGEDRKIYLKLFVPDPPLEKYAFQEEFRNQGDYEANMALVAMYSELVDVQEKIKRYIRKQGKIKYKNLF